MAYFSPPELKFSDQMIEARKQLVVYADPVLPKYRVGELQEGCVLGGFHCRWFAHIAAPDMDAGYGR